MNSYIDCHSHILYGIDDGSKNIEQSIEILNNLSKLGFKEVVLTPHYISYYHANNSIKRQLFNDLKERINRENINIKLYLANEVRITSNILDLIKKDEISLLGNYLFLELPFNNRIYNLDKIIYELQANNINVVLVHPERYNYLSKDEYQKLIDSDVLFQVNYESIVGKYGFNAKKRAKYLLKNNMVSFLATDVHKSSAILFKDFDKIKNKIIKIVGEETFNDLSYNNMKEIISNIKEVSSIPL